MFVRRKPRVRARDRGYYCCNSNDDDDNDDDDHHICLQKTLGARDRGYCYCSGTQMEIQLRKYIQYIQYIQYIHQLSAASNIWNVILRLHSAGTLKSIWKRGEQARLFFKCIWLL